jgi:nicotinamidase-related amidase
MSNMQLLASGIAALICVVIAISRAFGRRSTTRIGEDLTVSRTWLIEHSARKSD